MTLVGPVLGEQRSGTAPRPRPSRRGARTAGRARRAGVDEHDVACGAASAIACSKPLGRTGRIDEADRQAARRQVGNPLRQPLDALAEVDQRHLAGRAGALGGVDHERAGAALGEGGAQALEQHAAEGDVRVRDHRHEAQARARRTCGAGRRPGRRGWLTLKLSMRRSWRGWRVGRRHRRLMLRGGGIALLPLRRGEDQVHVARRRSARRRCRRRAAPAAPARSPTGGASPRARAGRWRRRRSSACGGSAASSAGPSLTASSIFD